MIVALVEAELRARGQRIELLESEPQVRPLRGAALVNVHLDDPTGEPELVIDTERQSAADSAETVLAFIDGHSLG